MPTPEDKARENIDRLLTQAGWAVRDQSEANILAYRGVAIRNFTLKPGHGFADYLLYVDGRAAGVIEAKKEGVTLTGVETQSERYTKGLPDGLPAWRQSASFLLRIDRRRNPLHQRPRPRATLPPGVQLSQTRNSRRVAGNRPSVASRRSRHRLREANRDFPLTHAADAAAHRRSLAAQAAGDYEARAIACARTGRALSCRWRPAPARRSSPSS